MAAMMLALAFVGCGGGSEAESNVAATDAAVAGVAGSGSASADKGDAPADAAAADKAAVQNAAENPAGSGSSEGSSSTESKAESYLWSSLPLGTYAAWDRFSGDKVEGYSMVLREVAADRIVFDYATPGTSMSKVAALVDSSGHAIVEQGSITLDITLGADFIQLDEIEGMGAIALVFR